jgi:hypothetical protein
MTDNVKIIAFSGKKQSGKSTSIEIVKHKLERLDNYIECLELDFSALLKSNILNFFCPVNWGLKDLNNNKDFMLPTGKTVRQQLQWLGTDILRKEYEDCFVNAFKSVYERVKVDFDCPAFILVSDVRFPNEVKCIQELGGHVIRFLRNPFPEDNHESEVALNAMESRSHKLGIRTNKTYAGRDFDAIIDNRDMTVDEKNNAVWQLINEKGWV